MQLKFEYAPWTLAMIRQLILKQFDVRLSEVAAGRLMRQPKRDPVNISLSN